jgi:hypothetical protein
MAMSEMPMAMMAMMAVPVMAMTAMTAMTSVAAVAAAGEGLTWDCQRGGGQRQNRNSSHNRLLDPSHARLLFEQREDRPAMIQARRAGCEAM